MKEDIEIKIDADIEQISESRLLRYILHEVRRIRKHLEKRVAQSATAILTANDDAPLRRTSKQE